jgi:hypothetical protein
MTKNNRIRIQDPNPDPDPLVRGMDPRIRIPTKMSWIRNTAPPGPPHCGEREVPGGAGWRQHHRHRRLDDHLRGRDTQLHRRAEHRGRLLRVHPDGDLCERGGHVRGVPARARGLRRSQFTCVIHCQSELWIRITLIRILVFI